MKAKLTNRHCASLPLAESKPYIVRDTELPGFFVIVGQSTRSYAIQIDVKTGGKRKTVRKTIGNADEWSADGARKEAKSLMAELRANADKHVARQEAVTFGEAWADMRSEYEALVEAGERSQRTLDAYADYADRLLADWHDTPLRTLGRQPEIVERRHKELSKRGGYQANRCSAFIRKLYNHALRRRLDKSLPRENPVTYRFNAEKRRNTGMGPAELKGWSRQLRRVSNLVRREFHLLILLSGSRPDSLKRARWEHLDLKKRVLHLPTPKGGEKRAYDIPLSRPMILALCRLRRAGRLYGGRGDEWIFPSDAPSGHIVEYKEKRDTLSHYGNDLRQTFRGMAVQAGIDEFHIRLLMNHAHKDVSEGYLTVAALRDHLRAQQQRVSAKIIGAMGLDIHRSFRRDIAARLQGAVDPNQARTLETRRRFLFSGDRP